MSRTSTFYGLTDANEKILSLAKILSILLPVVSATITLSTTFFMIFVAEAVGQGSYIEGLTMVGVLVVIELAVQTSLDYPTGAIGDWIGQRYIISSAFLTFSLAFYLVSLVTSATPIALLVLIYVLMGVGDSQMSGSFNAWFDNNYRVAMPGDKDRKQYGVFWGRVGVLFQIVSTAALIPGSILAVFLGRAWVFQLQAVLCIVIAVVVMRVIKDFPEVRAEHTERPSMSEYTDLLKSGVSFLFSDRYVLFMILGATLINGTGMVWGNLILFPMYFSYLLTDVAVSSFRTLLFFTGIFTGERSAAWSRRFEPKKWIPRFRSMQSAGALFYFVFAAIIHFFPPVTSGEMITLLFPYTQIVIMQLPAFSVLPALLMTITFTITGLFAGFAELLTQRELLDVIPNRIRNSIYSLSPTIALLFAIPQIAFFGWLIPTAGFPLTLVLCALISLLGVGMVRKGLSYPKPVIAEGASETKLPEEVVVVD
jgi:MFS family permease